MSEKVVVVKTIKKRLLFGAAALAAFALVFGSCGSNEGSVAGFRDKPVVAVSIEPQAYLVQALAGGLVEVLALVGPGQSPHAYEPSPRQMSSLSAAALWFTVGVDFETGLSPKVRALYPRLAVADTTEGVVYRSLEAHAHEEGEGPEDEELEGGPDPHIWLGRQAVEAQLKVMLSELKKLLPSHAESLEASYRELVAKIDAMYGKLSVLLEPMRGSTVLVYHPAFGYFLDDFGLRQVAVETGGKEPSPRTLAAILEHAREEGATTVFVQAQFPAAAAATVARSLGGTVAVMDPLARDWLDNLYRMGQAIAGSAR